MHAVVTNVTIASGQSEGAKKALNTDVVPRVRQAPGFVKGFWALRADGAQGLSMVVFQSKEQAETAAGMVRNGPVPPGVTLSSVEVREIVAEA
jgi:hypothetical protein